MLRYSTRTFKETGRIGTGGDPHQFVQGGRLYVASQDAGTVTSYEAAALRPLRTVEIPAAHGIFVARNRVYVTNIAGGGEDALWTLNRGLDVRGNPIDTDVAVPHNVAVTRDRTTFITHSGPTSDQVSVIDRRGRTRLVTVGTNPFGLAVVD